MTVAELITLLTAIEQQDLTVEVGLDYGMVAVASLQIGERPQPFGNGREVVRLVLEDDEDAYVI